MAAGKYPSVNAEAVGLPIRSSSPAERMRLFRQRRRRGIRRLRIHLGTVEIDALIAKSYLDPKDREDLTALGKAADAFISDALCDMLW